MYFDSIYVAKNVSSFMYLCFLESFPQRISPRYLLRWLEDEALLLDAVVYSNNIKYFYLLAIFKFSYFAVNFTHT